MTFRVEKCSRTIFAVIVFALSALVITVVTLSGNLVTSFQRNQDIQETLNPRLPTPGRSTQSLLEDTVLDLGVKPNQVSEDSHRPTESIAQLNKTEMDPAPQKVLLLTYGRSGSTFTSEIISFNEDMFYVFEPLAPFENRKGSAGTFWQNMDGTQSKNVLESFFSCNFTSETVLALDSNHLRRSESTETFYDCQNDSTAPSEFIKCYFDLVQKCRRHKIIFLKTIRFAAAWLEDLMIKYPGLKVLYLVRDPRATLYSQSRVFKQFTLQDDAPRVSQTFCKRVHQDVEHLRLLKESYPDRVKAVRYEYGVEDPMGYAEDIYRFLGLPVTPVLQKQVLSLVTPKRKSTTKSKPTRTPRVKGDEGNVSDNTNSDTSTSDISALTKKIEDTKLEVAKSVRNILKGVGQSDTTYDGSATSVKNNQPSRDQTVRKTLIQGDSSSTTSTIVVPRKNKLVARSVKGYMPHSSEKSRQERQQTKSYVENSLQHAAGDISTKSDRYSLNKGQRKLHQSKSKQNSRDLSLKNDNRYVQSKPRHKRHQPVLYDYTTHRDNPIGVMNKWRYDVGMKVVSNIDQKCSFLYETLGYRTVLTQAELENTKEINLVGKPHSGGIFD